MSSPEFPVSAIMLVSWPRYDLQPSSTAFAVRELFILNLFLNLIRKKKSYKLRVKSSSKWEHGFCSTKSASAEKIWNHSERNFSSPLSVYRLMSQFLNYWLNWNLVYLFAFNINKMNAICFSNICVCLLALITVLWLNMTQQNTVSIRKDLPYCTATVGIWNCSVSLN